MIRYMVASTVIAGILLIRGASGHEIKAGNIVIIHPWAGETVAHATVCVVYMTIQNHGKTVDRLSGAVSTLAERIEVHDTQAGKESIGMPIDLPVGAVVKLRPGGSHLMLFGLKRRLVEYDSFHMTLQFEKAGAVDIEVQVETTESKEPAHQ